MDAATFEKLLCMVAPMITHKDTVMREAISLGERLAVTLRFLATGEFFPSNSCHPCLLNHCYFQVKNLESLKFS